MSRFVTCIKLCLLSKFAMSSFPCQISKLHYFLNLQVCHQTHRSYLRLLPLTASILVEAHHRCWQRPHRYPWPKCFSFLMQTKLCRLNCSASICRHTLRICISMRLCRLQTARPNGCQSHPGQTKSFPHPHLVSMLTFLCVFLSSEILIAFLLFHLKFLRVTEELRYLSFCWVKVSKLLLRYHQAQGRRSLLAWRIILRF